MSTPPIRTAQRLWSSELSEIVREEAVLPDGRTAAYEVLYRPPIVGVIAIPRRGSLVLIRQYRATLRDWIWEIPAGKLRDETSEQCAIRELEEEAGYRASSVTLLGSYFVEPGYSAQQIDLYLTSDLKLTKPNRDADEFIEVHEKSLDDALQMTNQGEIRDSKTALAILLATRVLAAGE